MYTPSHVHADSMETKLHVLERVTDLRLKLGRMKRIIFIKQQTKVSGWSHEWDKEIRIEKILNHLY